MTVNKSFLEKLDLLKPENRYINPSKLPAGEYRYRIVMEPLVGWSYWDGQKTTKFSPDKRPKVSLLPDHSIRAFWAAYTWDYGRDGLYILDTAQATVINPLETLCRNPDWADITSFDFTLIKVGMGKDAKYSIIPIPPKPMASVIKDFLTTQPVRLEALYEGGNPWKDLMPTSSYPESQSINEQQIANLDILVKEIHDEKFVKELETHLHINSIYHVPERDYQRAIRALEERVKSKKPKEASHEQRRMATVA